MQPDRSQLYKRLTKLRIQVPILALLLVLIHQIVEHTLLAHLPRWQHFATQVLFYGLVGPTLAWLALTSLRRSARETEEAELALKQAHNELMQSNRRLQLLIDVNHRLGEAEDEEILLEAILELPQNVVASAGTSLIRFDDREQPLPAVHWGDLDPDEFEQWSRHLSSNEVRESCACCAGPTRRYLQDCPAAGGSAAISSVQRVVCLALERGERALGILIIYLPGTSSLSEESATLLDAMGAEISLAVESLALRSRELDAIYRLQNLRSLTDLHTDLATILAATVDTLEVTGGAVYLPGDYDGNLKLVAQEGMERDFDFPALWGLARGGAEAEHPLVIGDFQAEEAGAAMRSMVITPLGEGEGPSGVLLMWSDKTDMFTRRRVTVAEMVAKQLSLLVENHRLYVQVEHQAALEERSRLAREIHDGIAQMLGYLKLRTSQLINWMGADRSEDVREGLIEVSDMIGEAYTDAREAIDGLRLRAGEGGIADWQGQALTGFWNMSGIEVSADDPPELPLSPEVNSQLLRITQEALGNIRKHSGATAATLRWGIDGDWLMLKIKDNGKGFHPDEVLPISRHGLQTMRERSELLGADFQITSKPDDGTEVSVRIPLSEVHGEIHRDS
jgi:two-component system nitrate/nitrite sensor histidine kinase NarX